MSKTFARLFGSGIGGTTLTQALILLAGVGSGVTLARSLGPAGRGELAIALLWPGILVLLGDLGLGFALSYYAGKREEDIGELWTIALLMSVPGGGALALAGWFLLPHFVHSLAGAALRGFGLALFSVPLVLAGGFQSYLLLGRGLVRDYNLVRLASGLGYLLLVAAVALSGRPGVQAFVLAYVLAQAAGAMLSGVLVARRFHPRPRGNLRLLRKSFAWGLRTQLASIAAQTNLRADQAVMSILLTPAQLGLYVVAVSVSGVLAPLMNALAVVILPRTTHAGSAAEGALVAGRHVRLACLVSLPVLILSVIAMPWLLPAFFGSRFAPAVLSARVLVVAGLFQGLNAMLGNSLRGLGLPAWPAIAEGAGMAVTLTLLFLLLGPLGILGAALASFAAYLCVSVILLLLVSRAGGISPARLVFNA